MAGPLLHELKRDVVLRPGDAQARHALAEALFTEGDFRAAAKHLERALAADPTHANARRLLARAYQRDGREASARELLEAAVRRFPDSAQVRDELSDYFAFLGRNDDALLYAEEAARLAPPDVPRLMALAELYAACHLLDPAVEALRRACEGIPGDARLAERLARLRRELSVSTGTFSHPGPVLLAEVLDAAPVRAAVEAAGLGAAVEPLRSGEPGAAKRLLVTAPAEARATPAFKLLRAELLLQEGDVARAEAAYREALALPLVALRLGDLLAATGREAEARACFESMKDAEGRQLAARRLALVGGRVAEGVPAYGRIGVLGGHPRGGCVSPLEALAVEGTGQLRVSGNIGPSIRESAEVAFTCLKARASFLGIASQVRGADLHLHCADTEQNKDGPSGGLALTLAGVAAFQRRPLLPRLAATGEITLTGEVRPVGGVHEKMVAACLAGISKVLYPRRNGRDVEALPPEVKRRLALVPVDTLNEALPHALAGS
ncbi:tetratricopeptide repeat protein [Myxococcaceae bacterium GXIMD 01537]